MKNLPLKNDEPFELAAEDAAKLSRRMSSDFVERACPLRTQAEIDELFARLSKSAFRSRFHLDGQARAAVRRAGLETMRRHACEILSERLAGAYIANDGRQTPMRGYPVFVAQHALGLCCRHCMKKWHGIEPGRELSRAELAYAVELIVEWIKREMQLDPPLERRGRSARAKTRNRADARQGELDLQ